MRSTVINNRVWLVDYTNEDLDGDKDGLITTGTVSEGEDSVARPIEGVIQLNGMLVGKELLESVIHEWLHTILPMATEEWVTQEAKNLVGFITDRVTLTKIGLFNNIILQGPSNES